MFPIIEVYWRIVTVSQMMCPILQKLPILGTFGWFCFIFLKPVNGSFAKAARGMCSHYSESNFVLHILCKYSR